MMLELFVFDLNLFYLLSNLAAAATIRASPTAATDRSDNREIRRRFKTRFIVFEPIVKQLSQSILMERLSILSVWIVRIDCLYRLANYHNLQFKSTSIDC